MFVVMNRFPVNPKYAEQFETRIRQRPRQVDSQPGFIRAQLLRPGNPENPYIVFTVWESKEDFENWVNSENFTEKHAGRRTLNKDVFSGLNKVETFDIILDTNLDS